MLAGKTVFIVEDNAANLSIAATLLREEGATVVFDMMGLNTVDQLRQFSDIDIILLDLNLRVGTPGYDICGQIKEQPELATIPVVAVSGTDPSQGMPRARQKGLNGFISKPIDMDQFLSQIATAIGGAEVWRAN